MKKYINLFLFSLFLFCGCEGFLDVKSDARLVVPYSLEHAQALLDDVQRMNEQTVPARGVDVADEYYVSKSVYNSRAEDVRLFYVWDYQEYRGHGNDWGAAYAPVFNANLALQLLNNTERTDRNRESWDNVKGSALFFRAFYFFKLLVVFSPAYDAATADSDHGIALRLDTDFNKLSVRASVRECYDQIFNDLNTALDLLPDYPRHVTRPSKGAVYALLSNIHHYTRNYEASLEYADVALSYHSDLIDLNGDEELLSFTTAASPFVKYNKETIFYAELTNAFVFARSSSLVDSVLVSSYFSNDLRGPAFFRMVDGNAFFKGTLTGNAARQFGGLSTAELYLNKAESFAVLNKPMEAIEILNVLLENRFVTGSILPNPDDFDIDAVICKVRQERRKELLFSGIRFADIKRYNKEDANIYLTRHIGGKEYTLEPNSSKYALPIPQDIIEITGIPQN